MLLLDDLRSRLSSVIDPVLTSSEENSGTAHHRLASILVVIYGDCEPVILMTEKPKYMKFHAGEIAFPGGKLDACDENLLDTALRETREEIGLVVSRVDVIGQLEPVATLNSGFLILPFISIVDKIPPLSANSEVEKILHIPLEAFLKTESLDSYHSHDSFKEMYTFEYDGQVVWGASARILKQIQDCLKS